MVRLTEPELTVVLDKDPTVQNVYVARQEDDGNYTLLSLETGDRTEVDEKGLYNMLDPDDNVLILSLYERTPREQVYLEKINGESEYIRDIQKECRSIAGLIDDKTTLHMVESHLNNIVGWFRVWCRNAEGMTDDYVEMLEELNSLDSQTRDAEQTQSLFDD